MFRFAPTLQSELHAGNLRILLINFLAARKKQKALLFRVDHKRDSTREDEETAAMQSIQKLKSLDIEFGELLFQKDRREIYESAMKSLFSCLVSHMGITYIDIERVKNILKIGSTIRFDDNIFGKIVRKTDRLVDIPIYNEKEGEFLYNFTSVVDDYDKDITHIVRGADHIENTITQIILWSLLSHYINYKEMPQFSHAPLCLDENGEKLSKSNPKVKEMMLNYLIQNFHKESIYYYLLFNHLKPRRERVSEYMSLFNVSAVSRTQKKLSIERLQDIENFFFPKESHKA